MEAIDSKYAKMGDFELADALSEISGVRIPKAIEEIRTAPVLHDHICEKTEMKKMITDFLGI